MSKRLSTYLEEQGFYFKTINDPTLTIYGQKVGKTEDEEELDSKEGKKAKKLKDPATDKQVKFATYLKIAQSIQE